jgi:hypothetical protein
MNSGRIAVLLMALAREAESREHVLAGATWTREEHDSLVALVEGCDGLVDAASAAFRDWEKDEGPDSSREAYARAAQGFAASMARCLEATHYLFGARSLGGPRAGDVARGSDLVRQAIASGDAAVGELPKGANASIASNAVRILRNFDASLGYANFAAGEYPRMIGPHGDYPFALARLAHAQAKLSEAIADIAALIEPSETPKLSSRSRAELTTALARTASSLRAANHAAALSAFVVTQADYDRIKRDNGAAGGARDENFFRAVLSLEYAFCCGTTPTVFSQRRHVASSIPNSMFGATQSFARAVHVLKNSEAAAALNGAAWLAKQMDRRAGGLVVEYYSDMIDAWQGIDNFGFGVMGLFHKPPFPPPSAPIVPIGPWQPEGPWNQAEHKSLVKMVAACDSISDAAALAFHEWAADQESPEGNRAAYAESAQSLALGFNKCTNGAFTLFGAPNRASTDRPKSVAKAFRLFEGARRNLDEAVARLPDGGGAEAGTREGIRLLEEIDRTPSYRNWKAADYPSVIGLHGDYGSSQRRLAHSVRYHAHALWDLARLADPEITPRFSDYARAKLNESASLLASSAKAAFRAGALEAFVVTGGDWERIRADTLAASGIRPASFFRSILALEYALDMHGPPVSVSGRDDVPFSFPNAMAQSALSLTDAVHNGNDSNETLVAVNGPGWLVAVMNRESVNIGSRKNKGLVGEFYGDSFDLWPGIDNYAWAVMGFFHGVPASPFSGR